MRRIMEHASSLIWHCISGRGFSIWNHLTSTYLVALQMNSGNVLMVTRDDIIMIRARTIYHHYRTLWSYWAVGNEWILQIKISSLSISMIANKVVKNWFVCQCWLDARTDSLNWDCVRIRSFKHRWSKALQSPL